MKGSDNEKAAEQLKDSSDLRCGRRKKNNDTRLLPGKNPVITGSDCRGNVLFRQVARFHGNAESATTHNSHVALPRI